MEEMKYQYIMYEKSERIATITINRPEVRNALTQALMGEMAQAIDEAEADEEVRVLIVTGAGEKAFVAIALYFSIMKVRPTPFCMLDEIDAALDDRNVERYASYLHHLCKKTQFIVITHRRGTMEAADVLYGVTMQEQGVSKILHMDLNQMEQELGIME